MELWQLVVLGIAGFVMSVISGIAGGGAGFVTTPLAIGRSFVGGRIAVQEGNVFIVRMFVGLILVSGIALIAGS